jgi:hypothetical protein
MLIGFDELDEGTGRGKVDRDVATGPSPDCLTPPVLIEDDTFVGPFEQVWNILTTC